MARVAWPILFLVGCNEYNLQGDPSFYADPNPPDLGVPVVEDRIVQVTVAKVDVLWVVDSSYSMIEEQTSLTGNFGAFMRYFLDSGLDYHIGVVTTDMSGAANGDRGKLRSVGTDKWIDQDTTDPVYVFEDMAMVGVNGSGTEQGLAAAYSALETQRDYWNDGFVRDDAFLSVIIISDENDYSSSTNPGAIIDWLGDYKDVDGMVNFSSIVGPDGGCATAEAGVKYLQVTRDVGGIEWSICRSDWSEVLERLGMQAAGLRREFFLSELPVEDTIRVWIDEPDNDDYAWTYDRARNSITFDEYMPDPLAEVHIEYDPLSAWSVEEAG